MKKILFLLGAFITFSIASAQSNNNTNTDRSTTVKTDDKTGVQTTTTTTSARKYRSGNAGDGTTTTSSATQQKSVKTGTPDDTRLEGSSPQTTSDIVAPEGSLNSRVAPVGDDETTTPGTMSDSERKEAKKERKEAKKEQKLRE